jgi:hypothetical protein
MLFPKACSNPRFVLALESNALGSSYRKNRLELDRELKFFKKEMDDFTNKDKFEKFNLVDCKFLKSFFIFKQFLKKQYENIFSIIETIRNQSLLWFSIWIYLNLYTHREKYILH